MHRPIIFDFDGVVMDSEIVSNQALAETLTEFGLLTTLSESLDRYVGLRTSDCIIAIETRHKTKLSEHFFQVWNQNFVRAREQIQAVNGVVEFVSQLTDELCAVASSSGQQRIREDLDLIGLGNRFHGRIFSAAQIARGKPHPDIYWQAAEGLQAKATDCIVIEDSPIGAAAGLAAGMTVIGLTAGSHATPRFVETLNAAGVHHIARSYKDVAIIIKALEN